MRLVQNGDIFYYTDLKAGDLYYDGYQIIILTEKNLKQEGTLSQNYILTDHTS